MSSSLYLLIGFTGAILVIEVVNSLIDHSLNAYGGIVPRTTIGLVGIPFSPLLHGGFVHVQSNAIGLLALGSLSAIRTGSRFPWVCLAIILLGGLGVWAFGRPAAHVGASGLVFGLFGYLLVRGVLDRNAFSLLVAAVVAGVFGWVVISGVLLSNHYVSWEGHICGLVAGALAGIMIPGRDSITGAKPSSSGSG